MMTSQLRHDIANDLGTIVLSCECMQRTGVPDTMQPHLARINRAISRMMQRITAERIMQEAQR